MKCITWKITIGEILSTFIAVAAMLITAYIAQDAITENNKNISTTSRAFIFVDVNRMKQDFKQDADGLEIKVNWKNFGVTPARNIVETLNSGSSESLPTNFAFPDLNSNNIGGNLAPGATMERHINFSNQVLQELLLSKKEMYTWGWIEYNDVFSDIRHRTEFCDEMIVNSKSPTGLFNISHKTCSVFNGFDETSTFKPKTPSKLL